MDQQAQDAQRDPSVAPRQITLADIRPLIIQTEENTWQVPSFDNDYEAYLVQRIRDSCESQCKVTFERFFSMLNLSVLQVRCGYRQCNQLCLCLLACSCTTVPYDECKFACRHVHLVNMLFEISRNEDTNAALVMYNGKTVATPLRHNLILNAGEEATQGTSAPTESGSVRRISAVPSAAIIHYDSTALAQDEVTLIQSKVKYESNK